MRDVSQIKRMLGKGHQEECDGIKNLCKGQPSLVARCQNCEVKVKWNDEDEKSMIYPAYAHCQGFIVYNSEQGLVRIQQTADQTYQGKEEIGSGCSRFEDAHKE